MYWYVEFGSGKGQDRAFLRRVEGVKLEWVFLYLEAYCATQSCIRATGPTLEDAWP